MKKEETLLTKFENEIKNRVTLKTAPTTLPEKVLVEYFKFFDFAKSNRCNQQTFLQVIKQKIGISVFKDEEISTMFNFYSEKSSELNYREFVNAIFQSQVAYSIAERMVKKEPVEFPQNRIDLAKHEENIRKNIDYIIYRCRNHSITSFFSLYYELFLVSTSDKEVTASYFHMSLKKLGIELSADDIQKIFFFVSEESQMMKLDRLFDYFLANFKSNRVSQVKSMFSKFDYMMSQSVSLQLIKELFNSKNFPGVKEGRVTTEELNSQFEFLTNAYSKYNKNSFIINEQQFLQFFAFLSAGLKEEKEFTQFIEQCFRYSELPQTNPNKDPNQKLPYINKNNVIEDLSLKNSNSGDLLNVLISQLNGKGDRAYIFFYKILKCNDFDSDGKIFEREFEKSINESRLNFSSKQTLRLFEQLANGKGSLEIAKFLPLLVPRFSDDKADLIEEFYSRLVQTQTLSGDLGYDQIVASFAVKQHPDFRKGARADYEIKAEFEDCLKTFLNLHCGSHLIISVNSLIRFFEFFGRNWDYQYLEAIINQAFKIKAPSIRSEFSRPYGTTLEVEKEQDGFKQTKPVLNNSSGFKFFEEFVQKNETSSRAYQPSNLLAHEENKTSPAQNYNPNNKQNLLAHEDAFKKKQSNHKTDYPYHVGDKKQSMEEDQKSIMPGQKHQNTKNYNIKAPNQTGSDRSEKTKSDESQFNKNKREKLDPAQHNGINSPEDGSIILANPNFKYNMDLNDKLEQTSVRRAIPKIENFDYLQKRLKDNVKSINKLDLMLRVEMDMTEQSDAKGFIDFEVFSAVLDKNGLSKNFKQQEITNLFVSYLKGGEKLHVQKFANEVRGQMTKRMEDMCIQLYDRITPLGDELSPETFKESFIPQKFKIGSAKGASENREIFANLLSLFNVLNLEVKGKTTFDLDEFLYLMDNFALFAQNEDDLNKNLTEGFK